MTIIKLSFVSLLSIAAACSSAEVAAPTAPVAKTHATVAKPVDDAFYGVVTSAESKLVTSEVDGSVRTLNVHPGQTITAGTTIAVLDDSLIAKQIEEARGAEDSARGQVLSAQAQAAEAGRQYAQMSALLREGAVARDAVRQAASAAGVASAQVKIAQGSLTRAVASRSQLEQLRSHATITAPIDGVVSLVKVSEGQMAGRGMPIARVSNPSSLKLRFAVPREARDRLVKGAKLTVTIKGQPVALAATVDQIGSTLEPPLQFAVVDAILDEVPGVDRTALLGALAEVRVL